MHNLLYIQKMRLCLLDVLGIAGIVKLVGDGTYRLIALATHHIRLMIPYNVTLHASQNTNEVHRHLYADSQSTVWKADTAVHVECG